MKKKYFILVLFVFIFCLSGCNSIGKNEDVNLYDNYVAKYNFGNEVKLEKGNDKQFTVAVIPDIQSYTHQKWQTERNKKYPLNQFEILNRQMEYIAKNSKSNGGPIEFAIVLGDLVNDTHWYKYEWEKADAGLSILNGVVPLCIIPGNHDYDYQHFRLDGSYYLTGNNLYKKYFGPESKYFKDKEWFGGFSESGMSSYSLINAGGQDFLFLGFDLEPTDEELEWAQTLLNKYESIPVILSTHVYLDVEKENDNTNNAKYLGKGYRKGNKGNSPKEIFEKFVYPNKNILFVLCGHCFDGDLGESSRIDFNKAGYPVYSILTNYQSRRDLYKALKLPGEAQECGDGWFRLMEFDLEKMEVHCKTYSTEFHTFETDEDSDFVIKFDFDWDERFN